VAINKCPDDVPREVPHLKWLMMLDFVAFRALPSMLYILFPYIRNYRK
jgi:hypothetical protein